MKWKRLLRPRIAGPALYCLLVLCLSTLSYHPYLAAEILGFQALASKTQTPRSLRKGSHSASLCSVVVGVRRFATHVSVFPSMTRLCFKLPKLEIKINYDQSVTGSRKGRKPTPSLQC